MTSLGVYLLRAPFSLLSPIITVWLTSSCCDGCFSLTGEYTIKHKTRKSRGIVFTTTNEEGKSGGIDRTDEMSFRRYFLCYVDDKFKVDNKGERIK